MPIITAAAFLIDFAILLGSTDHTERAPLCQEFTVSADAFRGCAPPDNLCSELRKECSSADIALGTCKGFETTCQVDACGACESAIAKCNSFDTHCEGLEQQCDEALTGCGCEGAALKNTPVVATCAPDQDMCAQLGAACVADGMDPEVCTGMADNVCPGARQLSCEAMQKTCLDEGGDCDNIFKTCAENLAGCGPAACHDAGTITPAQAVATCYAYPYALDTCAKEEPSAGICMSLLTWSGCGITTCEWIECMEDVAALGDTCPLDLPSSCKAIVACKQNETEAPPVGFSLPWRIPPQSCPLIESLSTQQRGVMCAAHPFGRPLGCTSDPPSAMKCEEFIEQNTGCNITTCEYKACADALAKPEAECLGIPPECEAISNCKGSDWSFDPPWRGPLNCCESHGNVEGQDDTCNLSHGNSCIGCDYQPVLCMTHGCSEPGEQDCCLSPEGETVAC